nr:C592 [uncultured bacterium]
MHLVVLVAQQRVGQNRYSQRAPERENHNQKTKSTPDNHRTLLPFISFFCLSNLISSALL